MTNLHFSVRLIWYSFSSLNLMTTSHCALNFTVISDIVLLYLLGAEPTVLCITPSFPSTLWCNSSTVHHRYFLLSFSPDLATVYPSLTAILEIVVAGQLPRTFHESFKFWIPQPHLVICRCLSSKIRSRGKHCFYVQPLITLLKMVYVSLPKIKSNINWPLLRPQFVTLLLKDLCNVIVKIDHVAKLVSRRFREICHQRFIYVYSV